MLGKKQHPTEFPSEHGMLLANAFLPVVRIGWPLRAPSRLTSGRRGIVQGLGPHPPLPTVPCSPYLRGCLQLPRTVPVPCHRILDALSSASPPCSRSPWAHRILDFKQQRGRSQGPVLLQDWIVTKGPAVCDGAPCVDAVRDLDLNCADKRYSGALTGTFLHCRANSATNRPRQFTARYGIVEQTSFPLVLGPAFSCLPALGQRCTRGPRPRRAMCSVD